MNHNLGARRAGAALLGVLLVVAGAACSGDDDGADGSSGGTTGQVNASTGTDVGSFDPAGVFPDSFDPITSTTPVEVPLADGTSAWVSDVGPEDGIPVLFVGGSSTSATVVDLVSFLSSAQEELGIRLISVERNGFGPTPLDPDAGYESFATTALGVLDELGVDRFSIMAISGGGPYAAQLAGEAPERVRSLHFAAAYSGNPDAGALAALCAIPADGRVPLATGYANDPASWWAFPADSVAQRIPGFVDAAVADGVRALQDVDGMGDPAPMLHEMSLFCAPTEFAPAVEAPAFLYYSEQDTTTPLAFADDFAAMLPNVVADRRDLVGNHDEQYRHWDQILMDLRFPEDPHDLVCVDGEEAWVELGEAPDTATRGACLWN